MFNGTLTHQCVLLNFKAICNVLVIVTYSDQTFPWFKVTIQYHLKSPLSHFHLVYRCTQYNKGIINTLTVTSFVSLDASEAMVLTLLYSFNIIQYHLKSPLSHFHLVYRCTQYNKGIINTTYSDFLHVFGCFRSHGFNVTLQL